MFTLGVLALLALIVLVRPQAPLLSAGTPAPPINLVSDTGQRVNPVQAAEHHAAVVAFFDVECDTCKRQAPQLCGIAARHPSATFVAVDAANESAAALAAFARDYMPQPCPVTLLVDPGAKVSRAYYAAVVPTLYVVDGSGNIASAAVGPAGVDGLEAVLHGLGA